MRDVAHSAAPPDQAPYAVAEAVFADAKAYLSSREAQQMSESELERELDRRGQELMRRLLQGHLDQRTPGEAAGPGRGGRRCRALAAASAGTPPGDDLRDGAGCAPGRVALVDGAETQLNRASDAARPYGVVIDLIHVAEYVCRRCLCSIATGVIEGACGTWSATVMEFTGARWCYPVPLFHPCAGLDPPGGQLGWSRGGSEAPGATKPAATSMRTGTSTTREYQRGTTPSDTLME